jgi:deoxyribose-phosphate aldolase
MKKAQYTEEELRAVTSVLDFSGTLTVSLEAQPVMERALGRPVETPKDYVEAASLIAIDYRFAAFAGWPFQLEWMNRFLTHKFPKKQMVVNFPYGTDPFELALEQMKWGLDNGAQEIDSVIPIQFAQAGDYARVEEYVRALAEAARPYGVEVKSIIRVADLMRTEEEVRTLCVVKEAARSVARGGGAYVKTCTGWGDGKATVEIIQAIKEAIAGTDTKVKASGGITRIGDALALLAAGADRLAGRWPIVAELESLEAGKTAT